MAKLQQYNQKRDFQKTKEPKGGNETDHDKLRFVVQHHIASRDHYDFRLQWHGVLLSWAVPKGPSYNPLDKRLAAHVEDHPLDYRHFEGNIPKGQYGGGSVMLWDEGDYEPENNFKQGLEDGSLKFTLLGSRLKGKWALIKMNTKEDYWLLIKEKDRYAKKTSGITRFTTGIRSGLTMSEIAKGITKKNIKNPFKQTAIQLARLSDSFPQGDDWVYELKYDGYRIIAYLDSGKARLLTRNGHDYQQYFSKVNEDLIKWANGQSMVLDGEMVSINNDGKTDFQALQNYMKQPKGKNLHYIVFDLLALNGEDLRNKPLLQRKQMLKDLLEDAPPDIHYSVHSEKNNADTFKNICEKNFEGLICKRKNSIYSGSRNGDWLKLKCDNRQEFVIGGYLLSDKRTDAIRCLLVGYFSNGQFKYAGRVGTGFSKNIATELIKKCKPFIRKTSPFIDLPKSKEGLIFVKPQIAIEVKFAEWTKDDLLRQASFKGIRSDKQIKQIMKEKPRKIKKESIQKQENNDEIISLTNKDKLLFKNPDITKEDVANYYQKVARFMFPYLEKRLLSLINCPKGIHEPCFFKKHPVANQGIKIITVNNNDNSKTKEYFYITDLMGIAHQVQMNTLEFHLWGSRVDDLEKPDLMVFDLDPDVGMELTQIRQGVKDLKNILQQLNLTSFLKTSGGKGYHVVVPFKPTLNWDKFKSFAKNIVLIMEQKWPMRYTSNMNKEKRKGKIFIDWLRNTRGATSVVPYSIRARQGAKVSMPIKWSELNKIAPDDIDMKMAIAKLKNKNPWENFFQIGKNQQIN